MNFLKYISNGSILLTGFIILLIVYSCTKQSNNNDYIQENQNTFEKSMSVDPTNIKNPFDYNGQNLVTTYWYANDHFSSISNTQDPLMEQIVDWWQFCDDYFHQNYLVSYNGTSFDTINTQKYVEDIDDWYISLSSMPVSDWVDRAIDLENEILSDYIPQNGVEQDTKKAMLMTISALKWNGSFWNSGGQMVVNDNTTFPDVAYPMPYSDWEDCMGTTIDNAIGSGADGLSVIGFYINWGGGPGGSVLGMALGCAYLCM